MSSGLSVGLGQRGDTPYLPLKAVAPLVRREIEIDPNSTYTELGVRSFNKGTFHRRTVTGTEFTWQDLYRIHKDDLIFSNIMAWEGAVAMAKPEDDNCIGNHRMLTCACDPTQVVPAYLAHYFTTSEGMNKLVAASTGTVARNRTLTATALGKIEVPVPPLALQERIVTRLDTLADKVRQVAENLDAIDQATEAMKLSLHHKLAGNRVVRLGEVIELHEESEDIRPEGEYPQVGVRGFGGGLFAKPAIAGTDTTYRAFNKLYWNAIVLSQVKGWEGALAVCPEALSGIYVSPEYRTFRCLPNMVSPFYLGELMSTPWFWKLLQGATRGVGARRERTRPEQFLKIVLPMPEYTDQLKAVEILSRQSELKRRHAAIRAANAALVPATLERVFQSGDSSHG